MASAPGSLVPTPAPAPPATMRVGVLASGSGTNLQALIDSAARGELGPARLAVVGVNVPDCGALARAQAAGLADLRPRPPRLRRARRVRPRAGRALARHQVELLVLAGSCACWAPTSWPVSTSG